MSPLNHHTCQDTLEHHQRTELRAELGSLSLALVLCNQEENKMGERDRGVGCGG